MSTLTALAAFVGATPAETAPTGSIPAGAFAGPEPPGARSLSVPRPRAVIGVRAGGGQAAAVCSVPFWSTQRSPGAPSDAPPLRYWPNHASVAFEASPWLPGLVRQTPWPPQNQTI